MSGPADTPPRQATQTERPRANSFNYVDTGITVPYSPDPAACTAYREVPCSELHRQIWLVDGARLRWFVSDTGDFDAAEIVRIKDELGHVFVDLAAPGVLDDFVNGMRRVLPDPACEGCANRTRCGRRFRAAGGPPFAEEEAWIAAHIASLRGRVLDVGCGEQLYLEQLAPLVRSGTVHYTGIDPDEQSLTKLRQALPESLLHLAGIEDFAVEQDAYDHVLSLRSLNHVADLGQALARMTAALRPGGRLLLVETTPWAMLRRREQVEAADRAPRGGHQHLRNLASEDVLPLLEPLGLRVVHHRPAARQTTNQWILLLERAVL